MVVVDSSLKKENSSFNCIGENITIPPKLSNFLKHPYKV